MVLPGPPSMSRSEEVHRLTENVYKTIMEQFNPSLRNFISMGKTYEKALASMTYAAKGYFDALVKMGELASESQGSKELGDVLFQMAEVHRQIQNQLEEMLKSFHNELLTQLEQKVELDSRYLSAALKKYQTEQRSKGDSLDKCQAELKKLRKKSQGSKNPQKYSDKELQEKKMRLLWAIIDAHHPFTQTLESLGIAAMVSPVYSYKGVSTSPRRGQSQTRLNAPGASAELLLMHCGGFAPQKSFSAGWEQHRVHPGELMIQFELGQGHPCGQLVKPPAASKEAIEGTSWCLREAEDFIRLVPGDCRQTRQQLDGAPLMDCCRLLNGMSCCRWKHPGSCISHLCNKAVTSYSSLEDSST